MNRMIPRGAVVAGLGRRFVAAVLDMLPLLIIGGALTLVTALSGDQTMTMVAAIGAFVLSAAYGLYQWWAYGARGAGIGAKAMGLKLVSMKGGEPIGWWRYFVRQLVYGAVTGTGVGGIALLVFLVIHERRQGWHDLAVASLVVEEQPEPPQRRPAGQHRPSTATSTVGLPPHLASTFSPQAGQWSDVGGASPQPEAASQAPWQPQAAWQPQAPWQEPQPGGLPVSQQSPFAPQQPTAVGAPGQAPISPQASADQYPPLPSPRTPQKAWIPLPTPSSVIEPSKPKEPRHLEDDHTRITDLSALGGRPGDEGWYVRLDDTREVELVVTVLLGRNPQKSPGDPDEVHLVPSSGDGRMISRTHVMIGVDHRGVFVVDRDSTNGTALVTSTGDLEPCPPGTQMRVREGQRVSYGNRWFTVLRRPAPSP